MALKPTIFKFRISLSDLNRDYYDTLNLTVAQHPSETTERMMVRVLAYCINAQEFLTFTKGLSNVEDPDIWAITLDEQIALWIDIGEPNVNRIKKACRQAKTVKVYCFNTKSDVWWNQDINKFKQLDAEYFRFEWTDIVALAKLVERTMDFSVTITENSAYFATKLGECEVPWQSLNEG
ncbi:YaeQ protein [hydrothermal vent metagenome]|uniref:YaeQ protein n=1 Tax=hydrothermal vent metagenome TaxID=652676 RepID=A0A3B0WQS5_9ZZZZ